EDDRRLRTLDDWAAKDVVWLDEFYDLTQRFPDLNSIRLVNIAGQPLDRKDRHIARMTLTGMTTNSPTAVDQFFAGLAQDAHYRPGPNSPGRNNGADFFRFPQLFSAHVDLERLPPDQFTRRLPDGKAGDKQEGEDGGIMDMGFGGFGGGAP
ncbi:MAG TPA: hypothetical protein VG013_38405, partial [Gemmataceae bacterium]|nr:hypothetical protein [Gemmataceae bacterium]